MRAKIIAAVIALGLVAFGTPAFASNEAYTYDAYGRMTSVTYADGSVVNYAYDNAGNRTVLTGTP